MDTSQEFLPDLVGESEPPLDVPLILADFYHLRSFERLDKEHKLHLLGITESLIRLVDVVDVSGERHHELIDRGTDFGMRRSAGVTSSQDNVFVGRRCTGVFLIFEDNAGPHGLQRRRICREHKVFKDCLDFVELKEVSQRQAVLRFCLAISQELLKEMPVSHKVAVAEVEFHLLAQLVE